MCFTLGECHWLVQTAPEHGAANDVKGKAGPRPPEPGSGQSGADLPAAHAQRGHGRGLHPRNGIRGLHVTQQVSLANQTSELSFMSKVD